MNDRCYSCGQNGNTHDRACPKRADATTAEKADYSDGWDLGRSGKDMPSTASPAFRLGYLKGESALEEAQNGCDREVY